MEKINLKAAGGYALVLGALYVSVGVLEILSWIGIRLSGTESVIPEDLFGGLALLVIGAVYLSGVKTLLTKGEEGLSFLFVGAILSATFGVVFLLIMGAHWLNYWLGVGEFSTIAEFRPEIWLFFISLPAAYLIWKWRKLQK